MSIKIELYYTSISSSTSCGVHNYNVKMIRAQINLGGNFELSVVIGQFSFIYLKMFDFLKYT